MVNWLTLLTHPMFSNPGLGPALAPTQDEYESPQYQSPQSGYYPQPRSLLPVSSSNPFLNKNMMIMMMLEKMRATKVSTRICWTLGFYFRLHLRQYIFSPIRKIVKFWKPPMKQQKTWSQPWIRRQTSFFLPMTYLQLHQQFRLRRKLSLQE